MKNNILLIITLLSFSCSLFAKELILSTTQEELLELERKIANEKRSIQKKDWLSTINLNASVNENNKEERTEEYSISLEQDIFKFGGIYHTIDLAKIQEEYDLLEINLSYESFLELIYTQILNINVLEYEIKQSQLNIKNKQIDIEIKKDEYSAGQIGITDLNDVIIDKNTLEEGIVKLEKSKDEYIISLKEYSDLEYNNITIPSLSLLSKDIFINNSKEFLLSQNNTKIKSLDYKLLKTEYYPVLSFTSSYQYNEEENTGEDSYNYGLKLSMPIDFSSLNKVEKSKLEYLYSSKEEIQTHLEKNIQYNKSLINIRSYEKLNKIVNKDIKLYSTLLQSVQAEFKAGYKAKEDVDVLENTKAIRELDLLINNLKIQIEYISLYY